MDMYVINRKKIGAFTDFSFNTRLYDFMKAEHEQIMNDGKLTDKGLIFAKEQTLAFRYLLMAPYLSKEFTNYGFKCFILKDTFNRIFDTIDKEKMTKFSEQQGQFADRASGEIIKFFEKNEIFDLFDNIEEHQLLGCSAGLPSQE